MTVERRDHPDDEIRAAARAVHRAALSADGVAAFGEQVRLRWADGAAPANELHLIAATGSGQIVGYAHRDEAGTAELAVDPAFRRQGYGRALLESLSEAAPSATTVLQVWSHGDLPAARALAEATGFTRVRELLQLRRPLETDPAPAQIDWPAGVRVRTFRPGEDDAAWLSLNARAFAQHPEQGRMTHADLKARMDEPWFDPGGFLIAERDAELIGFHWTKIHPESPPDPRLGEVYVLGVDPDHHGGGLGKGLTLAGLSHLYARGLRTVLLYVESDNAPALAVYHRLGFTRWSADVMYESPALRHSDG